MFHVLAYNRASSNDSNTAMSAVTDPVFSQRNSHFVFSEQYMMLACAAFGATNTETRLNMPSVNAISRHNIWPINESLTPASFPRIQDLKEVPFFVPMNEEMSWEVTDAGTEETDVILWVAPVNWSANLPQANAVNRRLVLRFTITYTMVQHAWGGPAAITFEQTPRGGWYCVNAAYAQSSNAIAFRLFFPRAPTIGGRILRPGGLVSHAVGDMITPNFYHRLGEWGRFHTFEPPQYEEYSDAAAGSDSVVGFMDVTFLGDSPAYTIPAGSPADIGTPGMPGY